MSIRVRSLPLALAAGLLAYLFGDPGAAAAHPVSPGFERFFTADKADASRGGRLLLADLHCTRCHTSTDAAVKAGRSLDAVGERVRPTWVSQYLSDPQAAKPGTAMPHVLADDPDKAEKVEALTHLLASTAPLKHARPDGKLVTFGRDTYGKVGCVACHGTRKADGTADKTLPSSVPLGDLKAKYTLFGLAAFLADPLATRPHGKMPKLLDAKEAQGVANFLLQGIKSPLVGAGTSRYAYYEGDWQNLPDFDKLKPQATGTAAGINLSVAKRHSNYALTFDGVFRADNDGAYTFSVTSDDGAKVYVDGKEVVNNDGVHPAQAKDGRVKLKKGVHPVRVTYFQGGGEDVLEVFVEGPGLGRQALGDLVAATEADLNKKAPARDADAFVVKADLAEKGQRLFGSLGCANCHDLKVAGKAIPSTLTAPALAKLTGKGGCLEAKAKKGVPAFSLSEKQAGALAAALTTKAPPPTPASTVADTLLRLNCYACHVRDKVGGPEEDLNKFFLTAQPEMGDEGRLPPPLDGVGAKMNPEYLRKLLGQGVHDRKNYMHTRMPGFGDANVGFLVDTLGGLDKLPAVPTVEFKEPASKVKATARHLTGGQALGCIKCHTFGGNKAEGVQGIDMALMTTRLKRDWFHAYVAEPQRIRPGTRMPASYIEGRSVLPAFFDGSALQQVEGMWVYLGDGAKARLPVGMGKQTIPLQPTDSAIIYRNFISGAGARGIGVGYPEGTHLAFDANEMRVALLWRGAFIDAARHWTDRGVGFEGPLGDDVVALAAGAPFAALEKADDAWPTAAPRTLGYRFRGYRLTPDDRPTFLYSFGDVTVEDFAAPKPGKEGGLKRTLTVLAEKAPAGLTYRAAVGAKVTPEAGGWFLTDGGLKVKAEGAKVRTSGGKQELLVPVQLKDGKATLTVEYAW